MSGHYMDYKGNWNKCSKLEFGDNFYIYPNPIQPGIEVNPLLLLKVNAPVNELEIQHWQWDN